MSSDESMTQEIRDRLASLETSHEERHRHLDQTLTRIANSLERVAENQNRMSHLGSKVDHLQSALDHLSASLSDERSRIDRLEIRQAVLWKVFGALGTIMAAAIISLIVKQWGAENAANRQSNAPQYGAHEIRWTDPNAGSAAGIRVSLLLDRNRDRIAHHDRSGRCGTDQCCGSTVSKT